MPHCQNCGQPFTGEVCDYCDPPHRQRPAEHVYRMARRLFVPVGIAIMGLWRRAQTH